MTSKISVIIPNYNEERFVKKCLDSVVNQTYKNMEVIVVDDGSSDGSLDIIAQYVEKYPNFYLYCQEHQNAAIARNCGMANARGDYYLFLDSDDYLYPDALEKLIELAEKAEADFVIGNMREMDEQDVITKSLKLFDENRQVSDYRELLGVIPAPSNKLYKASVIKENKLFFGNVRIGQDLNFFLKYLCCCHKIYATSLYVYAWRDVTSSMSRNISFRIFDIIESFNDVKQFYKENGVWNDYCDYVRMVEYHNYHRQMEKQVDFPNRKLRKLVVEYFEYHIDSIGDVANCKNFLQYKDSVKKCRIKLRFKLIYISQLYKRMIKN